ncbi:MAG: hypothetical protein ACOH2H_24715 [Cypionkella sp.]
MAISIPMMLTSFMTFCLDRRRSVLSMTRFVAPEGIHTVTENLRKVEVLLNERGKEISHETERVW